jgi:phosphoribosylglycinamide formyltransferase-1
MVALVQAASAAEFPAEIVLVISNRGEAPGLERAKAGGIPTAIIESKPFGNDRAGFEAALQATLEGHRVELVCLGGFMRLFTAEFAKSWYGRMLNIHPSLLPSFPGLDPHGQALRAGVKISGATVHFVIAETDAGPVVMQGAVPVSDRDTRETLAERILEVEHRIYPDALRLLASGKIRIEGEVCKIDEGASSGNFLISPAVI